MNLQNIHKRIPVVTTIILVILFLNLFFARAVTVNWSSDMQLTIDLAWDIDPSIAQMADETIWVVWASDRTDFQNDIYYKTSADNGVSWAGDTRLTFDSGEDIMPSIMQTADGTIWVVWASSQTENFELFFKTSVNNGVSWSTDTQLTINPNADVGPSIMQHQNGTIWVAWASNRGGAHDIYYKTSHDNGLTWSPDTQLTTDLSWDLHPSIIEAIDGTIWVAWASYRTGDFEIFYKKSTDNGASWSSDTQLTTNNGDDEAPSIIQTRDSSFWVVWQSDRKGKQYDIYYTDSRDNGSTWFSDTQLTTDNADDMSPTIMNSHEGRIWIAWTSPRILDQFDIFYTISDIVQIPGDVDGDGDVDLDDLYYVLIAYGMTIEDAMTTYGVPEGTDIDNDGLIDLDDLYQVLWNYGA